MKYDLNVTVCKKNPFALSAKLTHAPDRRKISVYFLFISMNSAQLFSFYV